MGEEGQADGWLTGEELLADPGELADGGVEEGEAEGVGLRGQYIYIDDVEKGTRTCLC